MQRDAKVTHYMWNFVDLVEGHQLQLTNNADQSRTFVSIYMHENRLYIMEGTVPEGDPPPGLFQQSLGFVDKGRQWRALHRLLRQRLPASSAYRAPGAAGPCPLQRNSESC
jgi:hypothetical protein